MCRGVLLCVYLPLSGLPAAHSGFEMNLKGNNWQQSARQGLKCHYRRRKPSKTPFSWGLARAGACGDSWKASSPGSSLHAVTYLLSFIHIYAHTWAHCGLTLLWSYCEFCMSVWQAKLSHPPPCWADLHPRRSAADLSGHQTSWPVSSYISKYCCSARTGLVTRIKR